MCGIGGLFFKKDYDEKLLDNFKTLIKVKQSKRGPDDFQMKKVDNNLYFFHNRLSIIDLINARQPLESTQGALVYNGEIYNFRKIKDTQTSYSMDSDTEVLLKGFDKEGINFLSKTNSMFAFGHYNKNSRIVTIVRDRIGIKPIYYINNSKYFAFASTITPLLIFSNKEVDEVAISEYYTNRSFLAPNTLFKDIKKLEPGSYREFDTVSDIFSKTAKWWKLNSKKTFLDDEADIIKNLDILLHDSIKERLVSDVPVGAYLSGGVDSSLICAIASKYKPNLETFTVCFQESKYDESEFAEGVCKKYNLAHNKLVVNQDDFVDNLEDWVSQLDDIVADPSSLLLYQISKMANSNGFKVMLSGEGCDELFGGYLSYRLFYLSTLLNPLSNILNPLTSHVDNITSQRGPFRQIKELINPSKFYGTSAVFTKELSNDLFLKNDIKPKFASDLSKAMRFDLQTRIPNDLLSRTDRATMAASIEARVPFLSHQIVDYSLGIEPNLRSNLFESKYIIKKLSEKYLPRRNIYRKKNGFSLPIRDWLRDALKNQLYDLIENSFQKEFINLEIIRKMADEHVYNNKNFASQLWAFMSLELSYRNLVKSNN